ncbi:MAG: ribonuclease Y [Candidatus Latescibacteria bacterium]|nr:ribonuclease Y [Candidatus Latescibacterota bacterium]
MEYALFGLGLLAAGLGVGWFANNKITQDKWEQRRQSVDQQVKLQLEEEDRALRLEFLQERDDWYKAKTEQEEELEAQRAKINERDKKLAGKHHEVQNDQEELRKELQRFKQQDKRLQNREKGIRSAQEELTRTIANYQEKLEMAAGLSNEEAKDLLLDQLRGEVKAHSAALIRSERARAREEADREAQKILVQAIQRCAVEEAVQMSTSSIALSNEGIKSRIIGKEGRNVRAFETATGVKVVVDDTPETVLLSSFDPAKREVAVQAMQKLVADGGFTPNRIEETVAACRKDLEKEMNRAGKAALADIGAKDCHADLPHYVGMMKFRTTMGQNLLQHSLEVAHLAGLMAAEMGLDVRLARRAGLLHDIGKTGSRELGASHIDLGITLSEQFDEHPIVREVIAEHHEDDDRQSAICFVVKAADTISCIRPGGRREDSEGYARRIIRLEEIAHSFDGVQEVFAINAGREVRVMVQGEKVSDDDAELLAFDIAERVTKELTFPGQVKVMVVREMQSVRYAKRSRGRRHNPRQVNPRRNRSVPQGRAALGQH